jgi:uncharacterized protein (DUF2249 family)
MSEEIIRLDVREDLRKGRPPFAKIMQAVSQLRNGQSLLVIAPFEPAPLYKVLGEMGFEHCAKPGSNGDFEVLFSKTPRAAGTEARPPEILSVDARGLEPPQPLVTILEALGGLPEAAELRAHTDRRPMHLYAQLEQRGFIGESEEQPDGSFVTHIRRRET